MLYHITVRPQLSEAFYVKSISDDIVFTEDISVAKVFKNKSNPVSDMLHRVRHHYDNVSMSPVIFKIRTEDEYYIPKI